MSIEEKLSTLKAQAETAKQKKLRAEMAAEAALRQRNESLKALKDEFDVDNIEEATQALETLKKELEVSLKEAETVLREIT